MVEMQYRLFSFRSLELEELVELEYTLRNTLPQLAKLYFVAAQVGHHGHKRGNTGNNVFQLAMQQCCETS